jgi:hypothetical protein
LAFLAFFLLAFFEKKQRSNWNPDAGLVMPFTQNAQLSASSNPGQIANVVDGDPNTAWQSAAPLPDGYVDKPWQNILLGKTGLFTLGKHPSNWKNATDGDLSTLCLIGQQGSASLIALKLGENEALFCLSLKCQAAAAISVLVFQPANNEWLEIGQYLPSENYSLKRFEVPGGRAGSIKLTSAAGFDLFEIAALAGPPKESLVFDFGQKVPVGTLLTRHWAGEGALLATNFYLSNDQLNWSLAATADPSSLHPVLTNIAPEIHARYLKVEQVLMARDWNKASVWEVKAYDRFGPYGPRPSAAAGHTKIKDLLGVNGYWSWGTDQYSDQLAPGGGPYRYAPVASHARNYHDMTWDLNSPADKINFGEMAAGKGTPAKEWLNWDREYQAWHDAGMAIQASLQFYRFKPSDWKKPEQEAREYAGAFVKHFGQQHGNGLVCSIEAGNEPWHYPSEVYKKILYGMASAAKASDPYMEVFPCALQAADPGAEKKEGFKNYMGARISQEAAKLLDGINVHAYSYTPGPHGQQKALHPEHSNSSFWEILNAIRWRDQNMPGKKIYLSEWGWDHGGGGEDCTHSECVGEAAAAAYAIRAAMIALRLGIDRATWFYYANANQPSSLYTRSGLTASAAQGFAKKMSFYALESLVALVGERYFLKTIQEDEKAWIYLLGDANGTATHLIAWRPVAFEDAATTTATWKSGHRPGAAFLLDGSGNRGRKTALPEVLPTGEWRIKISATPLVVAF